MKCKGICYGFAAKKPKKNKHSNPLCRVTPIENLNSLRPYDKEKYKEMIPDAAETVLGFFGFERGGYSNIKKGVNITDSIEII